MILKHGVRLVGFGLLLVLALVGGFIRSNVAEPSRKYLDSGVVDVIFRQNRVIDVDPYDRFWLTVSPELEVESVQVAWDGGANRVWLRKGELLPVQYELPGTYQIRVWQANGVELAPFTVRVFAPPEDASAPKVRGASAALASGDVQTMDACTVFPGFAVGRVYAGAYATNTIDKYPIRIVSSGPGCCVLTKYGGGWTKTYTFDAAGEQSDVVDVPVGQSWTLTKSGGGTATLSTNLPGRLSIDNLILTNGPSYAPVGESVTNRVWQLQGGDAAVLLALPGPYWVTNTPANVGSVFEWTTNGVDYVPFNGLTNIFYGSNNPELKEVNVWCRSPETLQTNQWTWIEGGYELAVNNADRNGNGVPDFNDGYFGCAGTNCTASAIPGMLFRTISIDLAGIDTSNSTLMVKFEYPASDPMYVTNSISTSCAGTFTTYTPADGYLRLWQKNGDAARNGNSFPTGDFMATNTFYNYSVLTNNVVDGRLEMYAEGIREHGQVQVDVTFYTTGGSNIVRSVAMKVYDVQASLLSLHGSNDPQNPFEHRYQGFTNETAGLLRVRTPAEGLNAPIYIEFDMSTTNCTSTLPQKPTLIGGGIVHDFNAADVLVIDPADMPSNQLDLKVVSPTPVRGSFRSYQSESGDVDDLIVSLPVDPPSVSLASKYRRINRQGIPLPDPSPTGEGEEDRLPNQAYTDMFSLTPFHSATDFSLPLEGGELTLEFRRTARLEGRDASPNALPLHPSEDILGSGWSASVGSRVIVTTQDNNVQCALIVDELGNHYRYRKHGTDDWEPDVRHSFNNDARRNTLTGPDAGRLTFSRSFGTTMIYEIQPTICTAETYYRLVEVIDRNQNRLMYEYGYNSPLSGSELLVTSIREDRSLGAGVPERAISMVYTNINDKIRLSKLIDPLARVTDYEYDSNQRLHKVKYPMVADENGIMKRPYVEMTYFESMADTLQLYVGSGLPSAAIPLCTSGNNLIKWVGLWQVTDPRGHTTTYTYSGLSNLKRVPRLIRSDGSVIYQGSPVLTSVATDDGTSQYSWGDDNSAFNLANTVTNTINKSIRYDFQAMSKPDAANLIGKSIVMNKVKRTHVSADNKFVEFTFSTNGFDNLESVIDISGNVINYDYATDQNKIFNLVSTNTIAAGSLNLKTIYEYGGPFNKMSKMTDAEGVSTGYGFDGNGNRTQVIEADGTPNQRTTTFEYFTNAQGRKTGFIEKQTLQELGKYRVTTFAPNQWGDVVTNTVFTGYGPNGSGLPLTTITDRDVMGRILTRVPPKGTGYQISFKYDNFDRVVTNIYPAAGVTPETRTTYRYDLNGNLARIADENVNEGGSPSYSGGKQIKTMTYDGMNRLLSSTIDMGTGPDIVTSRTYDPVGNVKTETDGNNKTVTYDYDALLRLTKKTFPPVTISGGERTYEVYKYDGPNTGSGAFTMAGFLPTKITNKRVFDTDNTYDEAYRLTKSERLGPGNHPTVEYEYNNVHKKITETVYNDDALGHRTTQFFYDYLYRVTVSDVDMDGTLATEGFVPNPAAYSAGATDIVTRIAYDKANNPLILTDAEGNVTTNTFDALSRLTKVEMPAVTVVINGVTTSNHKPTIDTAYDDHSNKEYVTDANGNKTKFIYDNRDRLITTILDLSGEGNFSPAVPGPDIVTKMAYDHTANVVTVTDPRNSMTETKYDNAYRVVEVKSPPVPGGFAIVKTQYDGNSNVTHITDPELNTTFAIYDNWNRPTSVTKAFGTPYAVTTYTEYDANSNIKSLTQQNDANGGNQETTYGYDAYDRKETETLPDVGDSQTRQTVWTYYRNGTVKTVRDPKGQVTENDYDRGNRLVTARLKTSAVALDETRTFTYNKLSKPDIISDRNGTTDYDYHENDIWLKTEKRATSLQSDYTVQSYFDPNGNRTKCVYPDTNRTLLSQYDAANRLTFITDATGITAYGYDKNGNRTGCELPNGVVTTSMFDALNRLTSMTNQLNGVTIYSAVYGNDLVGNRLSINETVKEDGNGFDTRDLTYTYDDQYRLTQEKWTVNNHDQIYTYQYDLAGNRTSLVVTDGNQITTTTYTHDVLNRLNTMTTGNRTVTYSYDLNGNRIRKVGNHSSLPKHYYTFDTHDRLIDVRENSANGTVIFSASYDYRTRRLTTMEGSGQQLALKYFRYDGGDSFQELASNTSNIQAEFVRGSGMGGGIGSILYRASAPQSSNPDLEFFTYNAVGHTVALTSKAPPTIAAAPGGGSGPEVVKSDLYEAFGNIVASTGSSSNNRLANTKERSFTLGLDNHGFRYYDHEIGRYISRDPIGYGDGLNVYVYTGNNPVGRIDPWGLDYVTVSEGNSYWVVQKDWWGPVDKDMRWVMLGAVSDGMVTLGASFGGGSVKVNHLMFAAKAFWGREGTSLMNPVDISGFGDEMQDQLIRWHLDRELNPTGQLRWEAPRAPLRTKTQKNLDAIQGWADYGGVIPVVGMAFDIPNTITYGLRGRKTEFAMGAVGIIPFYGDAIQYGKIVRKAAKTAGRPTTTILSDVTVVSHGKVVGRGDVYLRPTIEGIESGSIASRNIFRNDQGLLPSKPPAYYQEFVHPTPGVSGAGSQRIVRGSGGELYYTPDHYGSFIPLN